MKTILIETVTNGWTVRSFTALDLWGRGEESNVVVFNKIEDLQAALPMLLADDFKYTQIKYTENGDKESFSEVPGKGLWDGLKGHVDCREKK